MLRSMKAILKINTAWIDVELIYNAVSADSVSGVMELKLN